MYDKTPEEIQEEEIQEKADRKALRKQKQAIERKANIQKMETYNAILNALQHSAGKNTEETIENQTHILNLAFKSLIEKAIDHYGNNDYFKSSFIAQEQCRRTAATLQWIKNSNAPTNKEKTPLPHTKHDKQTELDA